MVTASLMQKVQIRKKNIYFLTKLFLGNFEKSSFGALGIESPHGGAMLVCSGYLCLSVGASSVGNYAVGWEEAGGGRGEERAEWLTNENPPTGSRGTLNLSSQPVPLHVGRVLG